MKNIVMSFLAFLVAPATVLAQTQGTPDFGYVNAWSTKLLEFGQQLTTFLMIAATLYFIWTVIGYIRVKEAKDSEEKKKAMIRGIIGLFVIVAIWGIVKLLASTLGVTTGNGQGIVTPCPPGMNYNTTVNPPRCI